MSNVFSHLHPQLQSFIEKRGWEPTPIQEAALPELAEGKDRLLIAPTGSGKTLVYFKSIFHHFSKYPKTMDSAISLLGRKPM